MRVAVVRGPYIGALIMVRYGGGIRESIKTIADGK